MQVTLGGGSWSVETVTDTDGKFNFSNLGEGVGLLNPLLPKGSSFQPLTTDLAVPLTDGVNRTVNLGLYGGKQSPTGLPMSVGMKASAARVKPEGAVTFMITVKNNMDHAEGDVLVTDLLPAGLTPTQIQTSKGTAWIGGQFAAAAIGQMDKGLTEAVTITAQMDANASSEKALLNRASVIYPESVAVQAQVTLNESSEVTAAHLPETGYGYGLSLLALMLGAVIMGLRALRLGRRPA
jgi:uncharacterized repeat protein (TIGR01451 family)